MNIFSDTLWRFESAQYCREHVAEGFIGVITEQPSYLLCGVVVISPPAFNFAVLLAVSGCLQIAQTPLWSFNHRDQSNHVR